jgi:excisionase family DNA binding protein
MPRPPRPKRFEDYSDVLTPEEAAELLRVSLNTVYAYIRAGEIPAWKVGRQHRIAKASLREKLGITAA